MKKVVLIAWTLMVLTEPIRVLPVPGGAWVTSTWAYQRQETYQSQWGCEFEVRRLRREGKDAYCVEEG